MPALIRTLCAFADHERESLRKAGTQEKNRENLFALFKNLPAFLLSLAISLNGFPMLPVAGSKFAAAG
ncbi:MAG TPA: hypothetical protein VGF73_03720, partial [Chthoniobacterales bacterium]